MSPRLRTFARLGEGRYDLCVVGGGIVGSRIAYEAARDGLRVALVDAGDFGGATSSASSKLIHGGLRYFVQGHIGVTRSSLREKRALVHHVAPGLARAMPIVVAVERRKWASGLAMRGALAAYDALGGWAASRSRVIGAAEARALVPALAGRPLGSCVLLDEAQVNDARLVLATALAAADAGATIANHTRVAALDFGASEVHVALRGPEGETALRAASIVNATGPWVDALRQLEDPRAAPVARLSKGVHVLLPLEEAWGAALSVHVDDEHNLFAAPFSGMLLVGVTDTAFEGDPATGTATDADIDLLLNDAQRVLPAHLLRRARVRAVTAGLRALPRGSGSTATAKREGIVSVGPLGMVSIAGGKLTTHRLEAMDALQQLPPRVRPRRRAPARDTIVASAGVVARSARSALPDGTLAHLVALYGARVDDVLAYGEGDRTAFEPIHPEGPDVWAQVQYAIANELALTVDDVVARRTTLAWRGLADEPTRERIARVLLPRLVPT